MESINIDTLLATIQEIVKSQQEDRLQREQYRLLRAEERLQQEKERLEQEEERKKERLEQEEKQKKERLEQEEKQKKERLEREGKQEKERLEQEEERKKERLEQEEKQKKERLEREEERLYQEGYRLRQEEDYKKYQERQRINEAEMLFIRDQFQETKKMVKNLSKNIGNIGERFGSFTEGLAYPSMRKVLYKQYGIDNTIANFLKRFPDGTEVELDAFGYTNGNINNAVVVEIKTHLRSDHIKDFKSQLQQFKHRFPEFANKHLYGIFATPCIVSKELREQVYNAGLQLAVVHDEIFDFKPNPKAIDFNSI